MDFCKLTEKLWKMYLSPDPADHAVLLEHLDPGCVIIGTGAHEFYMDAAAFADALQKETSKRQDVFFQFRDFWCQEQQPAPELCIVYGRIHIWWESEDRQICIDMDSRFSVTFRKTGDNWKCVHIHQSLPDRDQMDGEYYPLKLSEQLRLAQEKVSEMTILAQRDSLTGLMNFHTLENRWKSWKEEHNWLFILDLDDFKKINDTYGHVAGNHVLRRVASILSSSVRSHDAACRMGGDEFILLCSGLKTEESARHLADRILASMASGQEDLECWTGISIGATPIQIGEPLEAAMIRADRALYNIKQSEKNSFSFN